MNTSRHPESKTKDTEGHGAAVSLQTLWTEIGMPLQLAEQLQVQRIEAPTMELMKHEEGLTLKSRKLLLYKLIRIICMLNVSDHIAGAPDPCRGNHLIAFPRAILASMYS